MSADRLIIRLRGDEPPGSILLITQTFHDEWRARVDGMKRAPKRFLGTFGYVSLRGGEHKVVITFASPLRAWLTLSSFAVLALTSLAAFF
jgi:hypothetical protein